MTSYLILLYVLKSIFISGLFLGYYWVALRNKTFHYYNRFYLLLSMAGSFIIPLFNFNWFTIDKQAMPVSPETLHYLTQQLTPVRAPGISWPTVAFYGVLAISLFLLLVLAYNIFRVYQLKRRSVVVNMEGVDFIYTTLDQAPFSFLNNLFWKESISLDDDFGQKIFKHELTHIHQKHTLDVLFCQVINAVCWMNPFNWLIQKELKAIHEFIADKEAVGNNNVEEFAQLLLQVHYGKHFLNPTHAFYYSSIKRRLIMLTTSNSARFQFMRKALVLPVTLAAIVALSVSTSDTKATTPFQQPEKPVVKNDTTPEPSIIVTVDSSIHLTEKDKKKVHIPGNLLYVVNGNVTSVDEVRKIKPENIKAINVWKNKAAIEKYGQAGANGVIEITLKELTLK